MAAGLGLLRLPPTQFWSMTPRELAAALRGGLGIVSRTPMVRGDLLRLMHRFPDRGQPAQLNAINRRPHA